MTKERQLEDGSAGCGSDQLLTDRPDRVEGKWKSGELMRQWNSTFANSEPNT